MVDGKNRKVSERAQNPDLVESSAERIKEEFDFTDTQLTEFQNLMLNEDQRPDELKVKIVTATTNADSETRRSIIRKTVAEYIKNAH